MVQKLLPTIEYVSGIIFVETQNESTRSPHTQTKFLINNS
jgi:hypothetical protein